MQEFVGKNARAAHGGKAHDPEVVRKGKTRTSHTKKVCKSGMRKGQDDVNICMQEFVGKNVFCAVARHAPQRWYAGE